jgi:hypothetical protein
MQGHPFTAPFHSRALAPASISRDFRGRDRKGAVNSSVLVKL